MPRILLALVLLLPLIARADSGFIDWTSPTQNTDGTPLTNLGGFVIQYGPSATNLDQTITVSNPAVRHYVITGVTGPQYVSVKALNQAGVASASTGPILMQVSPDAPTCGVAPPPETRSVSCPAPTVGNWTQQNSWIPAAPPACWTAAWLPSAPPPGVCANPPQPLTTAAANAYEQRSTTLPLALIGITKIGLPCGPETLVRNGVKYCRVPLWRADGALQISIVVWPQNLAGTDFWVRAAP